MALFPLIANPAAYRPNTIDLMADPVARDDWLRVFEQQLRRTRDLAATAAGDSPDSRRRADAFARRWAAALAEIRRDPASRGELSIITLCTLRQQHLDAEGFFDPYVCIKRQENEAALAMLPDLLRELDAIADPSRLFLTLIQGAFAGNIFDLGCEGTVAMYESGKIGFRQTRAAYTARPWRIDDFDRLSARANDGFVHRKAVVFVDNAGSDVVLGMIPLARRLLQRGTAVVLTANTRPALNDILHHELTELIERIAAFDPVIGAAVSDGRLMLVPSGNGIPGIDLSNVSDDLAAAALDADLLIIEGMGRALETNYHARFTCDTLKIAMVKEQAIAQLLGGKLYDVVCRFEPAQR